ncbi:YgjP-like metallopeptidase domain-containing protein [uncultured Aeromicrobium sp.]|uniref:YgjP-like metallopeptidase domain-containing protein n=1 Tax=uncultured Aeromicrobium sp. TaxID=337820 RepID=UPI0025D995FD|nr:YgjP-like metallopeptidase domain-containing protein [uncultured Aeromicrobium sp.]
MNDTSRIEVRRSTRRRRTVQARREGDRTIVMIPASMSKAEEERVVGDLVAKLDARVQRRRAPQGDDDLMVRARGLSERYLGGAAVPTSVRWVSNQHQRWGSCSIRDGSIRLSDRLRPLPGYVVDYVLLHELAHLLEADHGPRFQRLLSGYERRERAEGFLEAVSWQLR